MAKISIKDIKAELTEDEQREIDALGTRAESYDADAPELTIEQIKQFKRMEDVGQSVSILLSPQAMMKVRSFGTEYTSVLSKLVDIAIKDDELVKKCL